MKQERQNRTSTNSCHDVFVSLIPQDHSSFRQYDSNDESQVVFLPHNMEYRADDVLNNERDFLTQPYAV